MTLLAPWFLIAATGASGVVTLLHLFAWQRPPAALFPTARFVPDQAARATSRALRPTDLALLVLRVLVLLLVGLALSRPVRNAPPGSVGRVLVADFTRGASDSRAVRDSVMRMRRQSDVIVVVDSQTRALDDADSLALPAAEARPQRSAGALSAGLIAALRAAPALRHRVDSLELVLVSPFGVDAVDEATPPIRALWPGRARIVIAQGTSEAASAPRAIGVRAAADDPVAATVRLLGDAATLADARIVRDGVRAEDSVWVRETGGVLIHWPVTGDAAWTARTTIDTVGALVLGEAVIAPFVRRWDSPTGFVIARWNDAEPAVVQRDLARGCVREARVAVPLSGDLPLRSDFARLVRALASPCTPRAAAVLDEATLAALRADDRPPLLATAAVAAWDERRVPAAAWLLGLALLAALAELWVRRSRGTP